MNLSLTHVTAVKFACRYLSGIFSHATWFYALRPATSYAAEASWNVMAHAQKPDFVFRRNGRVHLNRRGASVQSATGSRRVRISGSNAGYTMFRGSVKGTGYPLHSPVSPSLPLPCVTVCHHISSGVYHRQSARALNTRSGGNLCSPPLMLAPVLWWLLQFLMLIPSILIN